MRKSYLIKEQRIGKPSLKCKLGIHIYPYDDILSSVFLNKKEKYHFNKKKWSLLYDSENEVTHEVTFCINCGLMKIKKK